MERDETLCFCMGVTYGDIEDAVRGGAKTFEEVQEMTGCSTVCGGCEEQIREIVNELNA